MLASHYQTGEANLFLPTVSKPQNETAKFKFEYPSVSESYRTAIDVPLKRPVSVQSKKVVEANSELQNKFGVLSALQGSLMQQIAESNKGEKLSDQIKVLSDKVKSTQVKLNQLVSGGSQVITVAPETLTTLSAPSMSSVLVKVETKDHKGPIQFTVEILGRGDADLTCSVHTNQKVNLDSFIWQKKDLRKTMILRPFKAFDETLLAPKQQVADWDKTLWQPEAIFAQFFS